MPNYAIDNVDEQDFGAGEFEMGPASRQKHVEGKYWKIDYGIKEGQREGGSAADRPELHGAADRQGRKKLIEELDAGGGTTTGTMPIGNGRTLWLQVDVANSGEIYTLTIVEEGDMKQDVEFTAGDLAEALEDEGQHRRPQHSLRHGQGDDQARVGRRARGHRGRAEGGRGAEDRDPGAHRQRRRRGGEPQALAGSRRRGEGVPGRRPAASPRAG